MSNSQPDALPSLEALVGFLRETINSWVDLHGYANIPDVVDVTATLFEISDAGTRADLAALADAIYSDVLGEEE